MIYLSLLWFINQLITRGPHIVTILIIAIGSIIICPDVIGYERDFHMSEMVDHG